MIILDSTTKKLQALTAVAPSSALTYYISYVDIDSTSFAVVGISAVDGTFNEAATDIVAAPASGKIRQIKSIKIYNGSTGTEKVTLQVNNSGTARIIQNNLPVSTLCTLSYENGAWTESTAAIIGTDLVTLSARGANPSAPGADTLLAYNLPIANRQMLRMIGPSGLDTALQPAIFGNGIILLAPNTTTTMFAMGTVAPTIVGTASTPALLANSLREQTRRTQILSAATGGSASELRIAYASVWRGNGAGLGGFFYRCRFGIGSAVATQRLAVGLWAATGATTVTIDPSTLVNAIFIGNDAADTNLQIMRNDASGACVKIDLGASFPKPTLGDIYDITFFCASNVSTITYEITKLNTGAKASGILNITELPAAATFLAPHAYLNNGGTAAAVILDIMLLYIETDL